MIKPIGVINYNHTSYHRIIALERLNWLVNKHRSKQPGERSKPIDFNSIIRM